jgi:hypothetical protein
MAMSEPKGAAARGLRNDEERGATREGAASKAPVGEREAQL